MPKNIPEQFVVFTQYQDIATHLDKVIASADENRSALGFFGNTVYQEYARKEQLYVVVRKNDHEAVYCGHLLFDCRGSRSSILQMFISPDYRKTGLAKILLDHLKTTLTDLQYISIYARVAEDLKTANAFWASQEFYVQRVEAGGNSRKRTILVRAFELPTQQLFSASGHTADNPLGLKTSSLSDSPTFLLDLNVFYDLGPRRERHQDVIELFRLERIGAFQFGISDELSRELLRTASEGKTDPMQAYARVFPTFKFQEDGGQELIQHLAKIVFPERVESQTLSTNDTSDLHHLATAIQHKLDGFISNDAAILKSAPKLKSKYGLHVLSPIAFKQTNAESIHHAYDTAQAETLELLTVQNEDEEKIRSLLSQHKLTALEIRSEWALSKTSKFTSRVMTQSGSEIIGYVTWLTAADGSIQSNITVDESSSLSGSAVKIMLSHLLAQTSIADPVLIRLKFLPNQALVREAAWSLGFRGTGNGSYLTKLTLGQVVTDQSWPGYQEKIAKCSGLKFPDIAPVFKSVDQQIQLYAPDGNKNFLTLFELETLLAPGLFCLSGRPAVITPVQKDFALPLLGYSTQKSLLPQNKVALLQEKHYLSNPRTLKHFKRGTLILFYESQKNGGSGAIVSIARVQRAYLKSEETLDDVDFDSSVISRESLETLGRSKIKTVTVFDNILHFSNPISLGILQRIGCGKPTDLLTTHRISTEQLQAVLLEGTRRG